MDGIIWLASYPKSGNTWLRIFLANLRRNDEQPASINDLGFAPLAARRDLFDETVGISSSDLTWEEIDFLRPDVYAHLAGGSEEPLVFKIHDAYTHPANCRPVVPKDVTRGVIYIIRNPLDVAVSLAHHFACTIDEAIEYMADEEFSSVFHKDRISLQLPQRLLSWSGHVLSWVDAPGLQVHVMRYEDMLKTPFETFTKAARFAGWPDGSDRVRKAILFSDFRELKSQERSQGFKEGSVKAGCFFRKGRWGEWRNVLTEVQQNRILQTHGEVMSRFGYITIEGEINY